MELQEFFIQVEQSDDLEGVSLNDEAAVIKHRATGIKTKVPFASVEDIEWDELYGILSIKREPKAMKSMTRVVGYYSQISNFNKSKIGELKDRHKGNYAIPAAS